jgi:membrane protease YdiL (CAAX protease family)
MQGLLSFLIFLPFCVVVVIANLGESRAWARYTAYALLILTDLAWLGVAGLAALAWLLERSAPAALSSYPGFIPDWPLAAAVCAATGLLAAVLLIPAVRRGLARLLKISSESLVHTTALSFAVYEVGMTLAEAAFVGGLPGLAQLESPLTLWDVVFSGLPLLLLGLLGVGLFVRRSGRQVLERLGLRLPNWKHLLLAVALVGLLLALDYGINSAWEQLDPAGYDSLTQVTDRLYAGLMSVGGAVVIGLSAGICEEILFRGALQPRFGLLLAAILFTIGHVQYGFTPATLEVFIIGLVLGLVRNRANTTTAILIHAGYNTAGILIGLLNP